MFKKTSVHRFGFLWASSAKSAGKSPQPLSFPSRYGKLILDHQVFNIRQYCFPPVIQQPYTLVKGWVPYAPNPCRRDAFR
ncbi:MAG: hypothetical protein PHU14_06245, partial [Methylovulum sp.]|nr:hypothetical protein [Methylovulum sp.]